VTPSPGTRLGPYDIVAPIGAGGMGEVYRATDSRLHRIVAIKVVSEQRRARPDLRARFRVEAEAIATINHPHICQLYDIGQDGDIDFLVMEHVDGETLAARLTRGPLRPDRALVAAREMADALDAAHRHGIVHRDLKPANVMLTRTGIKLLDFGVARLRLTNSPVVADHDTTPPSEGRLTQSGSAIGTWRYMAPEQIRGGDADARSDIFALGAVIYEMLTGRPAFDGADHHALVTAIMESEPPPVEVVIPPGFEQIVRTCLAKTPEDRWQSAGDLRRALDTVAINEHRPPTVSTRGLGRLAWAVAGVALAGLSLAAGLRMGTSRTTGAPAVVRSILPLASGSVVIGSGAVAFAPDGGTVVYKAVVDGRVQLYRRALSDANGIAIPGTENASGPFFSPDGRWVGFYRDQQLMKVPIGGGRPTVLADLESYAGGAWGAHDTIIVGTRHESGLLQVPAAGGMPKPFTVPAPEDAGNDHRFPQLLPGERGVLFCVCTGPEETARIVALDLRSGTRKDLLRGSASAWYVPTGHLVYARDAGLFAMPFDLERLEISGAEIRVAADVAEATDGAPEYSFSTAGDLVYVPGVSAGWRRRLVFVDMQGRVTEGALPVRLYFGPRVSPDGRLIAVAVGGAKNNVWVYDVVRGTSTRVTFGRYHWPLWTTDGRLILPQGPPGRLRLVRRAAEPNATDEEITPRLRQQRGDTWTPDGRTLIYEQYEDDGQWDLWAVSPGIHAPRPLVASRFNETNARVSPDGRWLAYVSDENSRWEVYVRALTGDGPRLQVSVDGAMGIAWAPDSRRLFYRSLSAEGRPAAMMAVDVALGPALKVGAPKMLFPNADFLDDFDIMPDGTRFAMVRDEQVPRPQQLTLVLNWFRTPPASIPEPR
jgi:eukaryotic-like serine/threonine-protein kinase